MHSKQKMTAEYSAHPALASKFLNNTSPSSSSASHHNTSSSSSSNKNSSSHPAHYQHYKKHSTALSSSGSIVGSSSSPSPSPSKTKSKSKSPLVPHPAATGATTAAAASVTESACGTVVASPSLPDRTACSDDTTDHHHHQQHHHHHHQHYHHNLHFSSHTPYHCSSHPHHHHHTSCSGNISSSSASVSSGISSNGSTPSPSTTSSPLSTPTRNAASPHCCQMTSAGAAAAAQAAASAAAAASTTTTTTATTTNTTTTTASSNIAGCKKLTKFDPRMGPSPYRQLLPIALCILSFATVFSILIVYMDTTEIRHQQFRLNMSRDYELFGVAQDDPTLIAFLREIHMKKYPMHFLKKASDEHLNFTEHHELAPEMAHYVADLVGDKRNGAFIQSLQGQMGNMMTAPWLADTLNWAGVIIEPEPRRFFDLKKQSVRLSKMQVVHACVSPNRHPKEITLHNDEESDVRINSLLDEETSWFNSRVKCFPLYTVMLACNRVDYDLLSLGVHGNELEVLQTLPYNKVNIAVISIHLPEGHGNYIQSVTKFLMGKSYKLHRTFGRNYFYQKQNSNRTRKKDILMKKP